MNRQAKGLKVTLWQGLALLILCWCGMVQAQVPNKLNYQGFLTSAGGTPINSTVSMVFSLYTTALGGTVLYTENQTVAVSNGIFDVVLGSVTPLNLPFDVPYYLGVSVGGDPEMAPRQMVTASPYALRAARADALAPTATVVATQLADHSVTQPKLSLSGGTAGQVLGTDGTNLVWLTGGGGGGGISAVTASPPLASSGGTAPTISLTGTTAVANGGTGATTLAGNGVVIGQGTNAVTTAVGTTGQVLSGTAGAPAWTDSPSLSGNFSVAGGVGIGTTTNLNPGILQVASPFTGSIFATGYSNAIGGRFIGQGAGGTAAAPSASTANSSLAWFGAQGHTGSEFTSTRVLINMIATEAWSGPGHGTAIAFETTANGTDSRTERMRIDDKGNVGIPAVSTSPIQPSKLNVVTGVPKATAATTRVLAVTTSDASNPFALDVKLLGGATIADRAAILQTTDWNLASGGNLLLNPAGGNVGIGTSSATKAKLEIDSAGMAAYLVPGGTAMFNIGVLQWGGGAGGSSSTATLALYGSGAIAAGYFVAFSDERIKRIEGHSNSAHDLATLAGIEVTDYTYIDTIAKGSGKQKKLIAQQVEKVYPQAVSRNTDVVPDIYRKAEVKDGWVMLATDLKKGERVRLIGKKQQGIHEVLEVAPGRFRTDFAADGDAVFVFGREVNDFRSVDYEAIAMLNVSATQELNRRLEKQAADFAAQAARMSAQTRRIAELEQVRDAQTARVDALEMQATQIAMLKQQVAQLIQQQRSAGMSGVVVGLAAK